MTLWSIIHPSGDHIRRFFSKHKPYESQQRKHVSVTKSNYRMNSNPNSKALRITAKTPEELQISLSKLRTRISSKYRIIEDKKKSRYEWLDSTFDHHLYFKELKSARIGRILMSCRFIESTQTLLRDYASTCPNITIISDIQSKGCGRGKNSWISPVGGLTFSFNCTFSEARKMPFLQYIISLAVIEAIIWNISSILSSYGVVVECYVNAFRIKWPNDIYFKNEKIGGILCHSSYSEGIYYVTNGVGVNLDNKEPTICINSILKSILEKHVNPKIYDVNSQRLKKIGREKLMAQILGNFERYFDEFNDKGFQAIEGLYFKYWLHSGEKVNFKESDSEPPISLTIQGLTSSGFLLAVNENGVQYELCPDGNSFDFFSGLVYRKI